MGIRGGSHRNQVFLSPVRMGLNAATGINAGVSSSVIDVEGFSQLTLEISHVNSSADGIAMTVHVCDTYSGTYKPVQSVSTVSGVATLSDVQYTKAVSANDQWVINLPINYKFLKVTFTDASAHATSDTITVAGRLG